MFVFSVALPCHVKTSLGQGEQTLDISLRNSQCSSFRWNQELRFVMILHIGQSTLALLCLCFYILKVRWFCTS